MSFKREGNDTSLLSKLRTRRIKELLSEDIPEDEAKLLCNGRFACTVCPSNPIFDTVCMLNVHRKGKKHLSNMEVHLAKKRELKHLIAVRKHQQFMKDGTTTIKMAVSDNKGLLTSSPYDPRVKKAQIKKVDRKPILNLESNSKISALYSNNNNEEWNSSAANFEPKSRISAFEAKSRISALCCSSDHEKATSTVRTNSKDVISSSSVYREADKQYLSGIIKHCHQLKNIFKTTEDIPTRVTPYQSKFRRHREKAHQPINSASNDPQVFSEMDNKRQGHSDYLPYPFKKVNLVKTSSQRPLNLDRISHAYVSTQNSYELHDVPSGSLYNSNRSGILSQKPFPVALCPLVPPPPPPMSRASTSSSTPLCPLVPPPPPPPPTSHASTLSCTRMSSVSSIPAALESPLSNTERSSTTHESQMSQKLRQLQGSGWKRDWDGKWIKDENAEFDSDEEPPDIP